MTSRHLLNNMLAAGLLATGLLAILFVGCALSPDDGPATGTILLRMEVVIDDVGKSVRADLIDDLEFLSAEARISSLPDGLPEGCEDICEEACLAASRLVGRGALTVALDETVDPVRLILEGDVSLDLDSPGSLYRLDVDLLERGRRIEGVYAGDIFLDSGLEMTVESLTLSDLIPDDFTIDDIEICLGSDQVDVDPEDRCISDPTVISGTWDRDLNQVVIVYTQSGIVVEGTDSDSVLVRMNAALRPMPILSGCAEIAGLAVGSGAVEVTIVLDQPAPGPGAAGEGMSGDMVFMLIDAEGAAEITEKGRVVMNRTVSLDDL